MIGVLADAVLVVHVGIAVFVLGGLVLVVLGNLVGWCWVNNRWFRLAHLTAIAIVVGESWAGFMCPLTTLEAWLRSKAGGATYDGGFVEHWFRLLLFYTAPPWVFTVAYSGFGALVLATWWYWPPRRAGQFSIAERPARRIRENRRVDSDSRAS